jgi:hypothetical protein
MISSAKRIAHKALASLHSGDALLFLLFVVAIFQFPESPSTGLDPSWRMVLGRVFHDHLQFGRDIVYNYGPLGFLMANTWCGLYYWSFIAWQFIASCVFAGVIMRTANLLRGVPRAVCILYFLFFGIIYPDALCMIIIALLGLELVRRAGGGWRMDGSLFIVPFLAVLAMMKFPNLVLGVFVILTACVYKLFSARKGEAWQLAGLFLGSFLAAWIFAGQNPLNIPAFISGCWSITRGYQEAIGTPTNPIVLWKGVWVFSIIAVYLLIYLVLNPDKPRALAFSAILSTFIFMDWKHAFVRADTHTLVFFVSALVPVTAFPDLIEDAARLRWLQRLLLLCAGVLSVWAIYDITQVEETCDPYVRNGLAMLEDHLWESLASAHHPCDTLRGYRERLDDQKKQNDLPLTRKVVGNGTIDVLGFEQSSALFNNLNYSPRPVFQSMSAYNPWLARINCDFFASDHAPDFVLQKVHTIDDRLPTLDDPLVLRFLMRRYEFVHFEKDFALWKRRAQPPAPGALVARPLLTKAVALNTPLDLGSLAGKNLWARIDLNPSLLGKLQRFFYKPPIVNLSLTDPEGAQSTFTMPLSQARTGFILNPLIEDTAAYVSFAKGSPGHRVRFLKIEVAETDKIFFAPAATVELSEFPPLP